MKNEKNFYWWFEERLKYSKKKHAYNTWKNLNAAYHRLKEFKPKLTVNQINYKLIRDYELYLLESGNAINTVAEKLFRVKVIVQELVKCGIIEYHKNPFLHFTVSTERTQKLRITLEDFNKLEQLSLSGSEALVRDMYVSSFYCAGIRFGDLCRIRKDMIRDGRLCYTMHKTKKKRRIKLMPSVINAFFRYEGEFIFPTNINWDDEYKSISSRNAMYNKILKNICKKAGIPGMSFHTSRHSFADHAKKSQLDIHTLKDLFGHSNVKITEMYMQDFYEEETDQAFIQLFG